MLRRVSADCFLLMYRPYQFSSYQDFRLWSLWMVRHIHFRLRRQGNPKRNRKPFAWTRRSKSLNHKLNQFTSWRECLNILSGIAWPGPVGEAKWRRREQKLSKSSSAIWSSLRTGEPNREEKYKVNGNRHQNTYCVYNGVFDTIIIYEKKKLITLQRQLCVAD